MSVSPSQVPSGVVPLGTYWKLPEDERAAFRRKFRDSMQLPANRTPSEKQTLALCHLLVKPRTMSMPLFAGGGMGGGKSSLECMAAVHLARDVPHNRILMCRKEFEAFSASTLQELEEQVEACPDARHWPGKRLIEFANGSEIWYRGVGTEKAVQNLGSTQFGAVFVDEAPELEEKVYKMLQTRLNRHKPAAVDRRFVMFLTGNPYPGWIKEQFVTNRKEGYTFIPMLARDNEHLPDSYIPDMKAEMPEEWYRAFILGDWNAMVPATVAIPYELVDQAHKRWGRVIPNPNDCTWGVDVGHLGPDWTWIARRRGDVFDFVDGWGQLRIDETITRIQGLILETAYRPRRIVIDYDGMGAGVADGLIGLQARGYIPGEIEIVGLHAQKSATIQEPYAHTPIRYSSMKAQNAFTFRRLLESGRGALPPDDQMLDQDLTAACYDVIDSKIFIETKKLVKKKLGRSPDKGDAILLTMDTASSDEFGDLPREADEFVRRVQAREEAVLTEQEQLARRAQWLQNPFHALGVRSLPGLRGGGPDTHQDLGY